ncbi:MAG TPA: arginine deiminase family protein [Candidatus Polarisedimenticolaceae bacterium]|nr:arginine deiminase family protein [Candidatus Polarisedimenticolaceae bacterium]
MEAREGLCATCGFARRVGSSRGSTFILCGRHATDPAFAKYPSLPVRACAGYAPPVGRIPGIGAGERMLSVTSEVGRLREVLVHEPGPEVDAMVPSMMGDLLFDDILYGEGAREEHGRIRRALQVLGIDVTDAQDLLEDVLRDPEARAHTLASMLLDGPRDLLARLADAPSEKLAAALVGGLRRTVGPSEVTDVGELFAIPPLANWCFQRDPQIVIGAGVVFASMASAAREPETRLARAIFRFHPDLASSPVLHEPASADFERSHAAGAERARLEGGDVIVVAPDVIAVGLSERTNRTGIEDLAQALASRADGPRYMLVVEMPRRRAYMHLDTVFTPVDRDAALVYAPVVLHGGPERATVHEIDLKSRRLPWSARTDLLSALERRGVGLDPIPCGGDDPIAQQREQWTDGANALALAPGVIAMYDRNRGTMEALAGRGFRIVEAEDLLLGREEVDLDAGERVCLSFASHELSRARGGPHCLTHPLRRDP